MAKKREERTAVEHNINPLKKSLERARQKKALRSQTVEEASRDVKEPHVENKGVSVREHDPNREQVGVSNQEHVSEREHVSNREQVGVSKREPVPNQRCIQSGTGYAIEAYKIVKNFADLGALFLLWNLLPNGEGILNMSVLSRHMNTTRATIYKRLKSLEEKGCLIIRSSGQGGVDLSLIGCIQSGTPFISSSSLRSLESLKSFTTTGVSEQEHVSNQEHPNGNMYPDRYMSPNGNMYPFGNSVTRSINLKYLFFSILACKKKPEDVISPKVDELFQGICSRMGTEQGIAFILQCLPKAKKSPDGYLYRTIEKGWSGAPQGTTEKAKALMDSIKILTTDPEKIGEDVSGKEWREASSMFFIGKPQSIDGIKTLAMDLQERLKIFQRGENAK